MNKTNHGNPTELWNYRGDEYTVRELVIVSQIVGTNLPESTIYNRLYSGRSVEDAVETPSQRFKYHQIVEYKGEQWKLQDLAQKVGMTSATLRRRLNKMSVEEAVEIPTNKGNRF